MGGLRGRVSKGKSKDNSFQWTAIVTLMAELGPFKIAR